MSFYINKLLYTKCINTSQYLTPDYFLPSSYSESYYSKKYSSDHAANTINQHHHAANTIAGNPIYQSKSSKISRIASVMLLSLSFLATALEVKAQPVIEPNQSFLLGNSSASTSTNVPMPPKMPQSPLVVGSNSGIIPPAPPPVPPAPQAPAMPD